LDEVANLIGGLHRSGAPVVADGFPPLGDGIEFIFEHWIERRHR
jgi:hypothetical protein